MAVTKKTVGSSGKSPKRPTKSGSTKVAATRITTAKIHTSTGVDASGGFK